MTQQKLIVVLIAFSLSLQQPLALPKAFITLFHINTLLFNETVNSQPNDTTFLNTIPTDKKLSSFKTNDSGVTSEIFSSNSDSTAYLTAKSNKSASDADSFVSDSLRKKNILDSLSASQKKFNELFVRFPNSVDSIFSPYETFPFQTIRSNATGISELLRFCPYGISVQYTLSSKLNRFLMYGFPFLPEPPLPLRRDIGTAGSTLNGTDILTPIHITSISRSSNLSAVYNPHPIDVVMPHTDFLWETGVFSENILSARVVRPLSRKVTAGFFSNYRYFRYDDYNHNPANVYQFYRDLTRDTSLLSNTGVNPLTNEHIWGLRLSSFSKQEEQLSVSYTYTDSDNDLSFNGATLNRLSDSLMWMRLSNYRNTFDVNITKFPLSSIYLTADISYENGVHNLMKLVSITPYHQKGPNAGRGTYNLLRSLVMPQLVVGSDTVGIFYYGVNHTRKTYSSNTVSTELNSVGGMFCHSFSMGDLILAELRGSTSYSFCKADGVTEHGASGIIKMQAKFYNQQAGLFYTRTATPYTPKYDTLTFGELVNPLDRCNQAGAEIYLQSANATLLLGYASVWGLDSSTINSAWPLERLPFRQPRHVTVVSPSIGRFWGLGLNTSLFISDTRPYIKSHSAISWAVSAIDSKQNLLFELLFDYWGKRDSIYFGGIDKWHRPITDISFRASVYIKTFSLFYKVDNLLNHRLAYIPGFYLPGLTFRWGFRWLISG